jgi:hypothetical protein
MTASVAAAARGRNMTDFQGFQACSFSAHRAHDWRSAPETLPQCGVCHPPADPSAALWVVPKPGAVLAECEAVIERGLATFIDVGQALLRIRGERLYRETHSTFEAYCRERWDLGRKRAYDYVVAAEVMGALSPMGDIAPPAKERVARELAPLRAEPDEMREAWAESIERSNGDQPTAAQVRTVVNGHRAEYAAPPTPRRARGSEIRAEHKAAVQAARSAFEHATRAGELLLEARDRVPGREWRDWLKRERTPERAASRYMDLASRETPESAARCGCGGSLQDDGRCVKCGKGPRS